MNTPSVSFALFNSKDELTRLPELVESFGETHNLDPRSVFSLSLALDELLTNVIDYGYCDCDRHAIEVTMSMEGDQLHVRIEDDGAPFNPLKADEPELDVPLEQRKRQIGGMGIHLVKHFMDSLSYERAGGRNVVVLTKRIEQNA